MTEAVDSSFLPTFFSALLKGLLLTGILLGLVQCDWSARPVEKQSLVVEAFLDTGEPLPPVVLRQTRPLSGEQDSLRDAASGGKVRLTLDGTVVPYEESGRIPGRYVPVAESIVVPSRESWRLEARWNGETAQAKGRTPTPIEIADVCVDVPDAPSRAVQVDSLRRDSLDIPTDLGYIYPLDVTIRWNQTLPTPGADTTYWVRAELRPDASSFPSEVVEVFLQPAVVQREDAFSTVGGLRQWTGVYAVPVDSADAPLPRHALTAALVRGDTSFASFAQTRTDPDRREPISNVDGGLGIAVAVSVDSLVRPINSGIERCRMEP